MDGTAARRQALDAAERLFYERGIRAVGMDEIRTASGVSLKRLYQLFPAKDQLVQAYLERRDVAWRRRLADRVERASDPGERVLTVFDFLGEWFREPGFRGCAWINAHGELGATSPAVAALATAHKTAFRAYLAGLVAAAGLPDAATDHLLLLAEGAMVTAGVFGCARPAAQAREAAALLLAAYAGARTP
ncbi:TetR/AcrR family transcriptional regulator [Streptomyces montanisoli]|uniref:TetR/AcrR family transcriptional regulator n=1 Tax=Streptomyces montanisoli TaxID=2798581 RepID=A0A940RWI7_9ACTN|nr:TetR/AcrR family transcriptional regulator [Streptomyces montanisoli]MBP0459306.1 TetR/AcrR family transcriptional regulator [Streptomyces montanisoli]